MPRERLRPGEHGKITLRTSRGQHFATTYVRDDDGQRRRVERSSIKSSEDARRTLQRHLIDRRTPVQHQEITQKTTLAQLFDLWLEAKVVEDGVRGQTTEQYRAVWRTHGAQQLGALRIPELSTSRANAHLQGMGATTQAKRLRMVLTGMLGLAVRFDVIAVNPIRETRVTRTERSPVRAATTTEFARVWSAITAYADREGPGPRPARLLPAFIATLVATGCRPSEVLALRWSDVDLDETPPTATISGTLVDHGRVPGLPLHRQDARKGGAPPHTVVLPRFGADILASLSPGGANSPVFANRDSGWMSLANMRRTLRTALPEDLRWITPHSFRRTVATVVRDAHGPAYAQQQLSHSKLATTEAHYLQRHTRGPDVRDALELYAESIGKVATSARVADDR